MSRLTIPVLSASHCSRSGRSRFPRGGSAAAQPADSRHASVAGVRGRGRRRHHRRRSADIVASVGAPNSGFSPIIFVNNGGGGFDATRRGRC